MEYSQNTGDTGNNFDTGNGESGGGPSGPSTPEGSLSGSEVSSSGFTGQEVTEHSDPCDCCGQMQCECVYDGACVEGTQDTVNSCCDCQSAPHYTGGHNDDPQRTRTTDVTYCQNCGCSRCSSCGQEHLDRNLNSDSISSSSDRNLSNSDSNSSSSDFIDSDSSSSSSQNNT